MLYASCKSSFVSGLGSFGIKDDQLLSIEIDSPLEVSPDALYKDIHPETIPVKKVTWPTPGSPLAFILLSRRPESAKNPPREYPTLFKDFEESQKDSKRPCCVIQ